MDIYSQMAFYHYWARAFVDLLPLKSIASEDHWLDPILKKVLSMSNFSYKVDGDLPEVS
mgnify:CR=1 FL=1